MSEGIPEVAGLRVLLAPEDLPRRSAQVDDSGIVIADQRTRGLVLEDALDLEAGMLTVRVRLDVVSAVGEHGIDLDRVVGLRPEGARVRDEAYVDEVRPLGDGSDWGGFIESNLTRALALSDCFSPLPDRRNAVLTCTVKAGMSLGKPDMVRKLANIEADQELNSSDRALCKGF